MPFAWSGGCGSPPKYNSQELDKETGFYFYNARYYDPEISRFTIADSVIDGEWDTQGWNRYAYVKGNPIIGKDPTGHALFVDINGVPKQLRNEWLRKVSIHLASISPAARVNFKTGRVYFEKGADTKHYKNGTKLLKGLIDKGNTTIRYTSGINEAGVTGRGSQLRSNWINAQNNVGTAAVVNYNPDLTPQTANDPKILVTVNKSGKTMLKHRHDLIGLAHELIHASHINDGTVIRSVASHSYIDANGARKTQPVPVEELRTVGLSRTRAGDVTENQIRKEQGIEQRAKY